MEAALRQHCVRSNVHTVICIWLEHPDLPLVAPANTGSGSYDLGFPLGWAAGSMFSSATMEPVREHHDDGLYGPPRYVVKVGVFGAVRMGTHPFALVDPLLDVLGLSRFWNDTAIRKVSVEATYSEQKLNHGLPHGYMDAFRERSAFKDGGYPMPKKPVGQSLPSDLWD